MVELYISEGYFELDCPGDTTSYVCAIDSNTEDLQVTWMVYLPTNETLALTYNTSSLIGSMESLDENIIVTLTGYDYANDSIESTLQLTLLKNASMNGTLVECSIHDLHSQTLPVIVDTSGTKFLHCFNVV